MRAGDYGEIAEKSAGDAGDEFTDISPNVAAAVFSIYHEYWYDSDKSADDNIESLKGGKIINKSGSHSTHDAIAS